MPPLRDESAKKMIRRLITAIIPATCLILTVRGTDVAYAEAISVEPVTPSLSASEPHATGPSPEFGGHRYTELCV